jgi:phosphoserine phosphatase RsbU/P
MEFGIEADMGVVTRPLRLLILEDSEQDAELLLMELKGQGYEPIWSRVWRPETLREALQQQQWDIVISDYGMNGFAAPDALRIVREHDAELPFIIVSGSVGEELAVDAVKAGANDFFLKGSVGRLSSAVAREVGDARLRGERARALQQLEESEQRLRALFNQMLVGLAQADLEQRFILVNDRFCELVGRSKEEVLAASVSDLLEDHHCSESAEPESAAEYTRPDGSTLWLQCIVSFVRDPQGEKVGTMYLLQDLTQQKDAEEQREALLEEMHRTVKLSEMFVGVLGHDLRNPLTAILAAAQLLNMTKDNNPAILGRLMRSASRMRRMIDDLLDFTRMRTGDGLPLSMTEVDLAQLCHVAIEEVLGEDERSDVRLEVWGDSQGVWDRERLLQLVSNLTSNAMVHKKPGTPVVVRVDGRDAEEVKVQVHNQGTIPRRLLPELFEPLQTPKSARGGSSGLGLGLYITRQIALGHGGGIVVRTSADHGTEFSVTLPRTAEGQRR